MSPALFEEDMVGNAHPTFGFLSANLRFLLKAES
jgi:hypothetical protein